MKPKKSTTLVATPPKMACTIHITCHESSEDGKLNVEMNYEGDTYLAAYLLQDAMRYIDERIEEENEVNTPPLRVVK